MFNRGDRKDRREKLVQRCIRATEKLPTKDAKVTEDTKKEACDVAREAGHATKSAPKTQT